MARKSDSFYFDNYNSCADNICKAAHLLEGIMRDYNPAELEKHMDEMHEIEQSSDDLRHSMMDTLLKAFITPIEREDLARLSSSLDDVTDYIEGVLHRLYYDNIHELTPGALEMVTMLVKAAEEVRNMIAELPNFKKPESLHEHVVSINTLESVGDEIFLRIMRELHTTETDPLRVLGMREIYTILESCLDACERVADGVEGIIMQNNEVLPWFACSHQTLTGRCWAPRIP